MSRALSGWPRTLWPTRDGWWCLGAALGLGFAAINTGNNLLYLLVSMLLGLVIVSGVLSEQSIRGLRIEPLPPGELYAGRPALLRARVVNGKRRRTSYSVVVETIDGAARTYLPRLEAGDERLVTWTAAPPARGRHRFPAFRVATRFPFDLFVKAAHARTDAEVLVYPAVTPLADDRRRALEGVGGATTGRQGPGQELHGLREYRSGDDPRLIHWRSSAKSGALIVREREADATRDARIVLVGIGLRDAERLERGLAEAASLAVHLLDTGTSVELTGRGVAVPAASGAAQRRRILTALALYDPRAAAAAAAAPAARGRDLRDLTIELD